MLHFETLSPVALDLVKALSVHPVMQPFALAGGTSLALRFGHRISIDLDFFTHRQFENDSLALALKQDFPFDERRRGPTGVTGFISGVKVDFVRYPYPPRFPPDLIDGLRLVSLPDVIAMKLAAITNRGAKKDFYDLRAMIDRLGLEELLEQYSARFPDIDLMMLLRSLSYFEDAEQDQDPHTLEEFTWEETKAAIREAVREVLS